jgi:diguanylate cyclase (GGDEF)-like protein/PAS domain S-box-containing protein
MKKRLLFLHGNFNKISEINRNVFVLGLLIGLIWLDFITPSYLLLTGFYLFLIFISVWYCNKTTLLTVGVLSVVTLSYMTGMDIPKGTSFTNIAYAYSSLFVTFFGFIGILINLKSVFERLEDEKVFSEKIIENLPGSFFMLDEQGRHLFWNEHITSSLGYSKEEFVEKALIDLIVEKDKSNALQEIKRVFDGQIVPRFELGLQKKSGGIVLYEFAGQRLSLQNQSYVIFIAMDVSERKKAEENTKLAALVYQASSESMMVTDDNNNIIAVNNSFTAISGYSPKETLGRNPRFLQSGQHDKAFYKEMWKSILGTGQWKGEIKNRKKNGEIYIEWLCINTIFNADGTVRQRVSMGSDITIRRKNEEMIWRQAYFDQLTGLPNRQLVHSRIEEQIKKSKNVGKTFAIFLLDIDRFSEINEAMGQEVGDALLVEVSKRIPMSLNEYEFVGRIGEDKFIIILNDDEALKKPEKVASNLLTQLSQPYQLKNELAFISAGIGITIFPNDGQETDVLLKNVDQAMHSSKRQGRNRFSFFTIGMKNATNYRMSIINDLHMAIQENQFRVYYQPIINLESNEIHKAEALLRWQHPKMGLVSPADFIPIAEETGNIIEIGFWVFKQVAELSNNIRLSLDPNFQISINKSPMQFMGDSSNHSSWFAYLENLEISPKSIVIEITEGLLMESRDEISNQLLNFRDQGIQVALDDFGTGYSSMAYLKKFDIDYIKIDQSFVRNLSPDSEDLVICEAMVTMAKKMGILVIAEGIETEDQANLLKQIGCDYGQGYFYSRPIPENEFISLLKTNQKSG